MNALLLATIAVAGTGVIQDPVRLPLPFPSGTTVVQTLSFREGERESFHIVAEASPRGIAWIWELIEVRAADTTRDTLQYVELAADIDGAPRIWMFHGDEEEHPGYTAHALSRTVYRRLLTTGTDSLQVMGLEASTPLTAFGGIRPRGVPVRWRGTVSLVARGPIAFPLLVNGYRVSVPALRLRGHFVSRSRIYQPEIWILADSTYPLVLKWRGAYNQPENVLQTVRVDVPEEASGRTVETPDRRRTGAGSLELGGRDGTPGAAGFHQVELELARKCRVELPGIYFAFNSSALTPSSDRAIAGLAAMLTRHPDWTGTLEGHTDSVGSASFNAGLSQRRVEAVRARLVRDHRIDAGRLKAIGYGSTRPREPNSTIEGRARNRRVELVRACQP